MLTATKLHRRRTAVRITVSGDICSIAYNKGSVDLSPTGSHVIRQSTAGSVILLAALWHVIEECTDVYMSVNYDWRSVFLFFGTGSLVRN